MQPDQISLSVDHDNDGLALQTQVYTRYEESQNKATYIGTGHLPDARNMIAFYRSFPTKSGNFKGVGKTSLKLTDDINVAGVDSSTLTAPVIIDVSFSVPVGATAADVKHFRQRVIALLDNDTVMDSLNLQLMV